MQETGPSSEDEMILAFLRAEIDSCRGPVYMDKINARGFNRGELIEHADLTDQIANSRRRLILGAVRGFGRGVALFIGFPSDATWRSVGVDPSDFDRLRYIGYADWLALTNQSRSVIEGGRNLASSPRIAARVRDTMDKIKRGDPIIDLILVETEGNKLVVLEGNTRATAYVALGHPFCAFVGSSPAMGEWHFV